MTDHHLDLLDLDAHRAGEPLAAAARAHLAWCRECQSDLAELQALAEALALPPPPVDVPPEREAALRTLAEQRAAIARAAHRRRPQLGPAARWTAAALLVLAIGALVLRQRQALPPSPGQAAAPAVRPTLTLAQADLNGDGRVDILDAFVLARAVTRGTPRVGDADRHDVDRILALAVSLDHPEGQP
ncbi:hypothetical protein KF840_20180 [bacterium]|nr:hypothetical protein [bacterium]